MISSRNVIYRPGRMAYVSATISGESLTTDYWTNYFGVTPKFHVNKGEKFTTPSGKKSDEIGISNIWGYSTKGIIKDDSLIEHLNYMITILKLPRSDLDYLLKSNNCIFRFVCFWANFTQDRVPVISSEIEKTIKNSGGIILIDEYN